MNWLKTAQATTPASRYTIVSGDTLSTIAQKLLGNQNRWTEIKAMNPGLDERRLQIGQVINIPQATPNQAPNTPAQPPANQAPNASAYKISNIKSAIMESEGFRDTSYFDPRNQRVTKAVGYGFNLSRPDAPRLLGSIGLNRDKVFAGTEKVTEQQALYLLDEAVKVAIADANAAIPNLSSHPETVQAIMVDMAYNMGGSRLAGFKRMIAALNAKNYKIAAKEMVDSSWYAQVGNRSKRLVSLMESMG